MTEEQAEKIIALLTDIKKEIQQTNSVLNDISSNTSGTASETWNLDSQLKEIIGLLKTE